MPWIKYPLQYLLRYCTGILDDAEGLRFPDYDRQRPFLGGR